MQGGLRIQIGLLPIFLAFFSFIYLPLQAQPTGTPTPAPSLSPSPTTTTTPVPQSNNEPTAGDEEKPFVPHWTGQLEAAYSNQPASQGQGQTSEELSFTSTYNIGENSSYISLEVAGGQQILEGSPTNYGSLTAEGAWEFGFFQPSLSLAQEGGAAALNSTTATLNLNFQWFDCLSAGVLGDGVLESHQGPVSTFSPLANKGNTLEEGDSYSWMFGLESSFVPWDFLTFSVTAEREYDDTYQFQDINHTTSVGTRNQYDRIDSLTLSSDFTFLKSYALDLSFEYGKEYEPAGVFYSPIKKRTLFNPNPTEQDFTSITVGLVYNL